MIKEVSVRQMGGSVGTTLPREMAEKFQLEPGDRLFAIDTDEGILLTPYDPEFARQMALAEEIMHDDREVLRALAK